MDYQDWQKVYRVSGSGESGAPRYVIGEGPHSREAFLVDMGERYACSCGGSHEQVQCGHLQAATVAQAYFATLDKLRGMTQEDFDAFYAKWWEARKQKMGALEEGTEKYYKMEAFYVALGETWRLRRKPDWRDVNEAMGGTLAYLFQQKEGE